MRAKGAILAVAVVFGAQALPIAINDAHAARQEARSAASKQHDRGRQASAPVHGTAAKGRPAKQAERRVAVSAAMPSGLSCVPYVRMVTGMDVSGNASTWWYNASGVYARGNRPEPGAVLTFRASGGMRSGHVAVVSRVVSNREVLIDHANWEGPGIRKGTVMRGVSVVDDSPNNDWSAVRVQVGYSAANYGRSYPTYGFIYNRPNGARATLVAGAAPAAGRAAMEEVAEAPSPHAVQHLNLSLESLNLGR
jgi:surface antigen